ncbi:MAG: DUF1015 family protein [Kineosporiaceae bacterium]
MAAIRAFRALRPPVHRAGAVASLPYDVMDTAEAAAMAEGNPDSFLHVSRPEIDLPEGTDVHSEPVYAQAAAALADLVTRGALVAEAGPVLFVYRQTMPGVAAGPDGQPADAVQTGLVACTSVAEYESGVIATHEHTRPDKEDDRTRHVEVLDAHDEPVFLMHRPSERVDVLLATVTAAASEIDLTSVDGVRHELWPVRDAETVAAFVAAFAELPRLYVADGHHRSAAAVRLAQRKRAAAVAAGGPADAGEAEWFLSVVFPAAQLTVLPYYRVVADLGGLAPEAFLDAVRSGFDVEATEVPVRPTSAGEFGCYLAGLPGGPAWFRLRAKAELTPSDPIGSLDVSVLQDRLLGPLLGIADPRTDQRISFVGGIRGTAELERLVDAGRAAVAFSLFPTSVEQVMDVADTGAVMPPKSTWFEPKLRSGLFVHPLD